MRRLKLGLLGERAVGEQLSSLAGVGYHVFHDVPGDGDWNVDHVVVGLAGVFAIERMQRIRRLIENKEYRTNGTNRGHGLRGQVLSGAGGAIVVVGVVGDGLAVGGEMGGVLLAGILLAAGS